MMKHPIIRKINVLEVEIEDISEIFQFKSEESKVETLLSLSNPNYETVLKQLQYSWNITMNDMGNKKELPTHLLFGASYCTNIKV